ncbi:MAG: hypothetical protein FE038_01155 [Thermoplasmata archaeon]|nr:MAG: hypothetical protein FE038_01155 [Thermoplasmata archaeon]RLF60596.1 MAG: hypothetical protein DRN16_04585 [Thermoplasmata archaeon]
MDIITLEDLSRAIANKIGIDIEEARRDASFVMDIFGFDDRVIDNVLDPEDRQLFYLLEEEGILSTEREETTLHDGREWRTHYWQLKKSNILKYACKGEKKTSNLIPVKRIPDDENIYETIDRELWISRKLPEK